MTMRIHLSASLLALTAATPTIAQDNVEVISGWNYDTMYESGWSVENMFDTTEVVDANGEVIGDVENLIFSDEGDLLGLIAEVGGFWDIGDRHVHVPWDEVEVGSTVSQVSVPVTEETVDDYDVFADYWMDENMITESQTESTGLVNDDLTSGPGVFKATDLMGDYAFLSDGVPYGYVADLIVEDGSLAGLVADASSYGRSGYYAYPYSPRTSPAVNTRYQLPYDAVQLDTIQNFDYDQLQSMASE